MTPYGQREELLHAALHAVGLVCGLLAGGLLTLLAFARGATEEALGCLAYAVSLALLFFVSTAYHLVLSHPGVRPALARRWQIADHAAIYFFIAGTYAPFALGPLRDANGPITLFAIGLLALLCAFFKIFRFERFRRISLWTYLLMGWSALALTKPLVATLPTRSILLLIAGGLSYSGGAAVYARKNFRPSHAIWHVMVLIGALCHYLAIFFGIVL